MKISFEAALSCLTIVVNSSLKHGTIEGVKEAIVRPLLQKAGLDYNDFLCFRPISNIPFVSKVIEKIVQRRTNTHLDLNNLNCDSQYGYKRNHGTETLLVHFVDQLLVAVDKKLGVVMLLIDLSAAFDTVCHSVLLRILSDELGIRGTALRWFKSFLTGRTQRSWWTATFPNQYTSSLVCLKGLSSDLYCLIFIPVLFQRYSPLLDSPQVATLMITVVCVLSPTIRLMMSL